MTDSDSDLSTPANLPTDTEIESSIQRIVRAALKSEEDITLKGARSRAEEELDLPTDFFKSDAKWKSRSKEIVEATVNEDPESEPDEKPAKKPQAKAKPKAKAGIKRKSDDSSKPQPKKRKKSPPVDPEESEHSEVEAEKPKPKPKSQLKSEDTSALSSPHEDESEPAPTKENGKATTTAEDDESDLSSVIDDGPPKKKRGSKSATSKSKPKSSKPPKSKATTSKPDLNPDEEEIKRLQSWLLKCGIRKLWHRELAPYSTPKEKIKHLKSMLEGVGMTGRFSAEKAKQIKESRELAAELESAREFNEQWGNEGSDEEKQDVEEARAARSKVKTKVLKEDEEDEPPVSRRPRGLVDFGDSGEESD